MRGAVGIMIVIIISIIMMIMIIIMIMIIRRTNGATACQTLGIQAS